MTLENVSEGEVRKFSKIAEQWWDPQGKFRPLHLLNPLRVEFIQTHSRVEGKSVLDVGCGGGILAEALAANQAQVIGLDVSEESLNVAKLHLLESQVTVEYVCSTVENFAERMNISLYYYLHGSP